MTASPGLWKKLWNTCAGHVRAIAGFTQKSTQLPPSLSCRTQVEARDFHPARERLTGFLFGLAGIPPCPRAPRPGRTGKPGRRNGGSLRGHVRSGGGPPGAAARGTSGLPLGVSGPLGRAASQAAAGATGLQPSGIRLGTDRLRFRRRRERQVRRRRREARPKADVGSREARRAPSGRRDSGHGCRAAPGALAAKLAVRRAPQTTPDGATPLCQGAPQSPGEPGGLRRSSAFGLRSPRPARPRGAPGCRPASSARGRSSRARPAYRRAAPPRAASRP